MKDEPTHNEDGSVDGHKSEESDNDEVFEDADLFSEIVTALSQVTYSPFFLFTFSVGSKVTL